MSKAAIVTVSTTNLPGRVGEQYGMHVVPVRIIFDEQSSRDGVDMTPAQSYGMLTQAPELPTEKVLSRFQLGEFYLTELTLALGARTRRGTLGLGWHVG